MFYLKSPLLRHFLKISAFLGLFFLIILDRFLKYRLYTSGGFYVCNPGISFGITLSNFVFWLLLVFFIIIFAYWIFFFYNKKAYTSLFIVFFVVLGALSNIFDRLIFGCVMDYLFIFGEFFPIFNFADVVICVSITIFVCFLIKNKRFC